MGRRSATLAALAILGTIAPAWSDPGPSAKTVEKVETPSPASVPLGAMDRAAQEQVRSVVEKASLAVRGPSETFAARADQYTWLLDHPHRAVVAWRRLGAKCVAIDSRPDGAFRWTDDQGSEVIWRTVLRGADVRVWLAEGKVRPAPLMPLVPVKAVVVLRHGALRREDGACLVQHQADLFVQTDSKTAGLVAKMLGSSAQRVAEQGLGQLQIFFSGMAWHMERHPDQVEQLFRADQP
jgi:hypothetical protein